MSWTPVSSHYSHSTAEDPLRITHDISISRKQNTINQPDVKIHEIVDDDSDKVARLQANRKFPRPESKKTASPVSFIDSPLAINNFLRSIDDQTVVVDLSNMKNTNIEVQEIADDNDADKAIQAQAKRKEPPSTQSRNPSRSVSVPFSSSKLVYGKALYGPFIYFSGKNTEFICWSQSPLCFHCQPL